MEVEWAINRYTQNAQYLRIIDYVNLQKFPEHLNSQSLKGCNGNSAEK